MIIYKSIVTFLLLIIFSAYMSLFERKLLGLFQNRYGPNRVGWFGLLQVFSDIIKMIFKEDFIPNFSEKRLFIFAPIIAFIIPLITFSIIPIGPNWTLIDFDMGILFFIMMSGLMIYPTLFAGWSSNNKYSLVGSVRAAAQMLSYEIFLGLSLMGIVVQSDSFNLNVIVEKQSNIWNVIPQFFGFLNFFISGIALCHRHPFDQSEAEQEISDGYRIEYSGIKFGLFFIGEYISLILICALTVTLFFGGWKGPILSPLLWFIIKTTFLIMLSILIRASIPRPRYDQVMLFGWKICFPISLINLLITSIVLILQKKI